MTKHDEKPEYAEWNNPAPISRYELPASGDGLSKVSLRSLNRFFVKLYCVMSAILSLAF